MHGIEEIVRQNRELKEDSKLADTVRSLGGHVPGDNRTYPVSSPQPIPGVNSEEVALARHSSPAYSATCAAYAGDRLPLFERRADFTFSEFEGGAHFLPITALANAAITDVLRHTEHNRLGLLYVVSPNDAGPIFDTLRSGGYHIEVH